MFRRKHIYHTNLWPNASPLFRTLKRYGRLCTHACGHAYGTYRVVEGRNVPLVIVLFISLMYVRTRALVFDEETQEARWKCVHVGVRKKRYTMVDYETIYRSESKWH